MTEIDLPIHARRVGQDPRAPARLILLCCIHMVVLPLSEGNNPTLDRRSLKVLAVSGFYAHKRLQNLILVIG